MFSKYSAVTIVALACLISSGCKKSDEKTEIKDSSAKESVSVNKAQLSAFAPLPESVPNADNPMTDDKIKLGRMLYYEDRISKNHDISCNSCHQLDKYGVDNEPTSPGHKKQRGGRNSPTVYNAALHIAQFWDGRAKDVEEQAKGPILNPVEMAMGGEADVLGVLKSMPEYVALFDAVFPEDGEAAVTYDNLAKAIGAFERKLMTPSRWDKYLKGDETALTAEEKKGFNTFIEAGCQTCHNGPAMGGNMYQKVGLVKAWPDLKDVGRAEVTGNEAEKYFFKVPSLRNIEKTGPYFHDGSVSSLEQAVKMMAEHQRGIQLSDEQATSIVTFLKALTGELPTDYIKKLELPPSTDKTPKPDPS